MNTPDLASLKASVEPSLKEGDFDALWKEFTETFPSTDPDDFLTWLHEKELLTTSVFKTLLGQGTLAPATSAEPPPPPPPPPPPVVKSVAPRHVKPTMSFTPEMIAEERGSDTTDIRARRRALRRSRDTEGTGEKAPEGNTNTWTGEIDGSETGVRRRQPRRRTGDHSAARRTGEHRQPRRRTGEHANPRTGRGNLRQTGGRLDSGRSKQPGKITTGRYDFVGDVGEGAMGKVLLAEDLDLNRKVAFKQMSEETARQSALAAKFYAEAQITAQLDHPNIVPIYSLERTEEGSLAYSMKLIRGKTFEDEIQHLVEVRTNKANPNEPDDLDHRLEQFLKVLDAMSYAHDRGIVHRDLKPENIMIGAYGEVYVMDWGIARRITGASPEEPVVLQDEPEEDDDMIIGTPQYMSPEQAHGKVNEMDGRSDQYSLGLILFELVSLRQAVTGKTPIKIVMRQQDGEKDPMVHIAGDKIDPALRAIVMKSTSRIKAERYDDLRAFAADIRCWMRGDETMAYPDNAPRSAARWAGKHRTAVMFTVMTVLLSMALLTTGTLGYSYYSLSSAAEREERLSSIITTAGRQAGLIDGAFSRYEGILTSVVATARQRLAQPIPGTDQEVFYPANYSMAALPEAADSGPWPGDLLKAEAYEGLSISLEEPVYVIPPSVPRSRVDSNIRRLAPIRSDLRVALLRSNSEESVTYTPKRVWRLIGDIGTPIAWSYLALESGLYLGYPGHGTYRPTFDARKQPWYEQAKGIRGPVWGAPHIDASGLGLLLPCSMAMYDENDALLGVGAIEVTFDYIINNLMESNDFPEGAYQAFLLSETGQIIIDSSKKGKEYKSTSGRARELRTPEFMFPEVVAAVREMRTGHMEVSKDGVSYLITYNRMNSIGWYYVVMGRTDDLL